MDRSSPSDCNGPDGKKGEIGMAQVKKSSFIGKSLSLSAAKITSMVLSLVTTMLLEKPIIAVVSGNLGESEVAQVMKETRLGFCFEEVDGKAGEEKLFAYLCQDWNRCRKGLPPDFHPKKDVIRQYDWEYLIEKFEELV